MVDSEMVKFGKCERAESLLVSERLRRPGKTPHDSPWSNVYDILKQY